MGVAESSAGRWASSPVALRLTTGWRTSWWTAAPAARSASPWRSDATTAGTAGSSSVRGQLRAQPQQTWTACKWEICLWVWGCICSWRRVKAQKRVKNSYSGPERIFDYGVHRDPPLHTAVRMYANNVIPSKDTLKYDSQQVQFLRYYCNLNLEEKDKK